MCYFKVVQCSPHATCAQDSLLSPNVAAGGLFDIFVLFKAQRLRRELQAEHDLAQKELRAERELMERELQESRRRLQQECEHRVALERDRVQLMEEERARLLQQVLRGEHGPLRRDRALS